MKNALVTGASRGIGKAVSELLCSEGYKVYGVYNQSQEQAEQIQKKLSNVEMLHCDLSNAGDVERLIKELKTIPL